MILLVSGFEGEIFAYMVRLVSGDPYEGDSSQDKQREEGGRWYYSRKEIEENSPSKRDGIDPKKEADLRKSYCMFLQDLGKRLEMWVFISAFFFNLLSSIKYGACQLDFYYVFLHNKVQYNLYILCNQFLYFLMFPTSWLGIQGSYQSNFAKQSSINVINMSASKLIFGVELLTDSE